MHSFLRRSRHEEDTLHFACAHNLTTGLLCARWGINRTIPVKHAALLTQYSDQSDQTQPNWHHGQPSYFHRQSSHSGWESCVHGDREIAAGLGTMALQGQREPYKLHRQRTVERAPLFAKFVNIDQLSWSGMHISSPSWACQTWTDGNV